MRYVNSEYKTIQETDVDLSVGHLETAYLIREDATPIDNETKWAWADEDYEEVRVYVVDPVVEETETTPTQLDRIEAQVTYTAMMTDTLLEG